MAESLVANKFNDLNKNSTWKDVSTKYNNDPEKIADFLNSTPDYKPGEKTKQGMAGFNYSLDENGKWIKSDKQKQDSAPQNNNEKPTNDNVINGIEDAGEQAGKDADAATDPKTGEVNKEKALDIAKRYEQRLVEAGAAEYDKDGKFVFKPINDNKKWQTWATLLSCALSVAGLAMGVPIIPINFKKITGLEDQNEYIKALQKQYIDIMKPGVETVNNMQGDVDAGKIALEHGDELRAQEEHAQNMGAYQTKTDIDTSALEKTKAIEVDAEGKLIDKRTEAQIKQDAEKFKQQVALLEKDQDFKLKYAELEHSHSKEMAELQSKLATGQAIDIMKYQNTGLIKDMQELGLKPKDIATYMAAKSGISPTDKYVGYITNGLSAAGSFVGAIK